MKYILTVIIAVISFVTISAQTTKYKFGQLESSDLTLSELKTEPNASAVIICDIGKMWFARNVDKFEVVYERFVRIKVLKEEGVAENEFFTIPLYYEGMIKEKLSDLKGITWNKRGNIWVQTELPKKTYNKEVVNDNYSLVTVQMPAVAAGSIIEYKYTITSPFFTPAHSWNFQNTIPTLFSFLEVRMIPFYEYKFLHRGAKFDIEKSYIDEEKKSIGKNQAGQYGNIVYNEKVYQFGLYNIPPATDRFIKMDFQLSAMIDLNGVDLRVTDTWEKSIKELLVDQRFGDFIKKTENRTKSIIEYSVFNAKKPEDKVSSMIRYVKNEYDWNGILGKYSPVSVKDFLKTKKGNSGTINLFTIGLLKGVGINAFPVILSTKTNDIVNTDYPFLHLYDYVLIGVDVNGRTYLVDATDDHLADHLIPLRCSYSRGLIIEKNQEKWIVCEPADASYTKSSLIINPDHNGSIKVDLVREAADYEAYILRSNFKDNNSLLENLRSKGYPINNNDIKVEGLNNSTNPLNIKASFLLNIPPDVDTLHIDPFLNESINVNPLKDQSANQMTDFYYKVNKSIYSEVIIPNGYTVVKVPEEISVDNSLLSLHYIAKVENNKVIVTGEYKFKKVIYTADETPRMNSYLNEIVRLFNEPVVLIKRP